MSRWTSYLNSSAKIIGEYNGDIPLSSWLKNFFRSHKEMGSNDRKIIAETVYGFYRLGHSFKELPVEERLLTSVFLCNQSFSDLLNFFRPDLNVNIALSAEEKRRLISNGNELNDPGFIFPWAEEVSDEINITEFNASFLEQPDLFLRIRPGHEIYVLSKLEKAGLPFKKVNAGCISLPNSTKADSILNIDSEVVVQDLSSQQTGSYFGLEGKDLNNSLRVWDCCAASGGKSIMIYDKNPGIRLTVSDVRESIMQNLHQRFRRAGISKYLSFITDLSKKAAVLPNELFDIILADLPCTGSGTWGRTPEQLYFFERSKIDFYSRLQKKIITTIVPRLKKGGKLVYITCSVFREENENIVEFIKENFELQLVERQVLRGYHIKADSMFVAVFSNTVTGT
ncbi:MAG: Fmu (Sun) domain-containing protein [Chitinophagaceae bacterium]